MSYIRLLLLLSLVVSVVSSCQKENKGPLVEAPQVSALASLDSDFTKSEQEALDLVALSLIL